MNLFLTLSLLIGEIILTSCSTDNSVLYCVKPSTSANCLRQKLCQKCEILQYYFHSDALANNQHNNVTLIFLSGTHTICLSDVVVIFSPSVIRMIGEDQNVVVKNVCDYDVGHCSFGCTHYNATIYMQDITFVNYYICMLSKWMTTLWKQKIVLKGCSFQNSSFNNILNVQLMVMQNCTFLDNSQVTFTSYLLELVLRNCTFFNKSLLRITSIAATPVLLENCNFYDAMTAVTGSSVKITGRSIYSSKCITKAGTVFFIYSSNITMSGNILFANNTGFYGGAVSLQLDSNLSIAAGANVTFMNNVALARGGAIYISSSYFFIESRANLTFFNNSARDEGGAIYVHPGLTMASVVDYYDASTKIIPYEFLCFFHKLGRGDFYIYFFDNNAAKGGDDIYGAALHSCPNIYRTSSGISAASSDPFRVCLCGEDNRPYCNPHENSTLSHVSQVYPGHSFTIPVLVVGVEYGGTTGVVYSNYIVSSKTSNIRLESSAENGQVISNPKECTNVRFTLFSNHTPENVTVYMSSMYTDTKMVLNSDIATYTMGVNGHYYSYGLRVMPVFLNVTILPCPSGFYLSNHRCDCYLHLILFDSCTIANGTGYFSWSSNTWTRVYEAGILYNTHCPFDHCKTTRKYGTSRNTSDCPPDYCKVVGDLFDLVTEPDSQCSFNRKGTLCGGCMENYSLAIGSSHCIHCPNNNNLALAIFFTAAGFLLVFFVSALNLTVSQGMVNGLVFYANVVWTYQSIFFSRYHEKYAVLLFLKIFIAWINLDFGIETCFVSRMTAFVKTWLQFIFPLYVWAIGGLMIIASKYSTRLTNLLGNRSVPVLNTLFLLSYMKLLRVVVTALEFSSITHTDQDATVTHSVVWSVDGNLEYFGFPHILLFLAGLIVLIVLCVPYTMLLLLMQCIRRLPHSKLTNWIMRFHPAYDAYFAPLKCKHQYWFGVLLLARMILLLTFVSTFAIPQYINLLLLLTVGVLLMVYISIVQPYKSTAVLVLCTTYFANLVLLTGFVLVSTISDRPTLHTAAVGLSTGIAFIQFTGTVLYGAISIMKHKCIQAGYFNREDGLEDQFNDFIDSCDRYRARPAAIYSTNETQPLLNPTNSITIPTY